MTFPVGLYIKIQRERDELEAEVVRLQQALRQIADPYQYGGKLPSEIAHAVLEEEKE